MATIEFVERDNNNVYVLEITNLMSKPRMLWKRREFMNLNKSSTCLKFSKSVGLLSDV